MNKRCSTAFFALSSPPRACSHTGSTPGFRTHEHASVGTGVRRVPKTTCPPWTEGAARRRARRTACERSPRGEIGASVLRQMAPCVHGACHTRACGFRLLRGCVCSSFQKSKIFLLVSVQAMELPRPMGGTTGSPTPGASVVMGDEHDSMKCQQVSSQISRSLSIP